MPLAPNVLLQANVTAATKSSAANNAIKSADSGKGDASSFSNVYAKQAKDKVADRNDATVKPARDKSVPDKDKTVAARDKTDTDTTTAADDSTVAESGNGLPADSASASTDDKSNADSETVVEVVTPPVTDPALDPALQLAAAQTPAALAASAAKTDLDAAKALPVVAAFPTAAPAAEGDSFDPEADPLDGLHAVQLALENANAKAHATQQVHAGRAASNAENDQSQNVANNLAALSEQLPSDESSTESSDKSFTSLISDGLKDTKSATGDTRVDNFAERLAALSQAAQPARTAASPAPLMNQPLAMNQSGWSEGIVDRVMYLSSQNLKSAEIKLEPAELGRLDIRVNMAPDQQTQVTFMSAHLGVREALENQMSRLRESFVQQGLGQVDVNVSDQSQQQAQQQAQEQAGRAQRGGRSGGSGSGDGQDDTAVADAATPVSQPAARVIGSSEIDFYA